MELMLGMAGGGLTAEGVSFAFTAAVNAAADVARREALSPGEAAEDVARAALKAAAVLKQDKD